MKKIATLILFFAITSCLNAQSDLFLKVKKAIKENYPEVNLEHKLIAVNVWLVSNQESRDANKQFNNVYKIYEFAKLKDGLKGLVCVIINKEGDAASIILNKDGATKLIQLNNLDVPSNTVSNFVFDENGKEVYKNIPSGKIFESINQLITR